MQAMISLRGVSKTYDGSARPALDGLSLDIEAGRVTAIMGPSGCGKSTLLNLVGGLDRPTRGEIDLDGVRVDGLGESDAARFRRTKVGFVFQFFQLLDDLSVRDNVLVAAELAGAPRAEARARAEELLAQLGLGDRLARFPATLSGGERQRLAIARAVVNRPAVLLADEPTGRARHAQRGVRARPARRPQPARPDDPPRHPRRAPRGRPGSPDPPPRRRVDRRRQRRRTGRLMGAVRMKALAGLRRRRLQAVVIAAVVVLATGAATMALDTLVESQAPYDHAFAEANGAHLVVDYRGEVTAAQLAATATASPVTAAAGPWPIGTADIAQAPTPGKGGFRLIGGGELSGRADPGGPVDRIAVSEGRWWERPGEIVLSQDWTEIAAGELGGTIVLRETPVGDNGARSGPEAPTLAPAPVRAGLPSPSGRSPSSGSRPRSARPTPSHGSARRTWRRSCSARPRASRCSTG